MNDERRKWHVIEQEKARLYTAASESPGIVYPLPAGALPSGIQSMSGLGDVYVSGYVDQPSVPNGPSRIGEIVVTREDKGVGKGYLYAFARSGDQVVFTGPWKPRGAHHFNPDDGVALDDLFGKAG